MKAQYLPPPLSMNTNKYLTNLLTDIPDYKISDEEKKSIAFEGIEKYIFNKLNSSNYKATSMPEVLEKRVKEKILKSVEQKKPIHITVPFGGYKKWQLPTYPYPDWSEVFYMILLRDYLSPISGIYEHGVLLEFFSDEIFVSRMNNIPQRDLDEYNDQFSKIVEWFSNYLPKNFEIKSSKIREFISQEEILKRFDKDIEKLKKKWASLPKKEREFRLNKSERNYKGDLSKLPKEEKNRILLESTLVHDAFIFGDWDKDTPWAFDELMIAIGNRYTGSWGIHIKSTKSSTNQFWVGIGVLKEKNGDFIPSSLTYNQYIELQPKLKEERVDLFPKEFKNLRSAFVIKN